MTAKFDARESTAAPGQLERGAAATGPHPAPGEHGCDEWQQRDEFKLKLISARVKLKLMRDRTDALKEALERFRTQRDAMRA